MSEDISDGHTESALGISQAGPGRCCLPTVPRTDPATNCPAQNVSGAKAEKRWALLVPASPLPGRHGTVIVKHN